MPGNSERVKSANPLSHLVSSDKRRPNHKKSNMISNIGNDKDLMSMESNHSVEIGRLIGKSVKKFLNSILVKD